MSKIGWLWIYVQSSDERPGTIDRISSVGKRVFLKDPNPLNRENHGELWTARSTSATGNWIQHLPSTSFERSTIQPLVWLGKSKQFISSSHFECKISYYYCYYYSLESKVELLCIYLFILLIAFLISYQHALLKLFLDILFFYSIEQRIEKSSKCFFVQHKWIFPTVKHIRTSMNKM